MDSRSVTVSLVTWNGRHLLPGCLASLEAQTLAPTAISILDNGSTDGSADLVQQWGRAHQATVRLEPRNLGFARAHNRLLREAATPFVLVLNQDVELSSNYLKALVDALQSNQQVGSVSGLLLRLDRQADGRYVRTNAIDSAGLKIYRTHRVVDLLQGQPVSRASNEAYEVFGLPAVAALYRRTALEAVAISGQPTGEGSEYFDESFESYKEDVDLSYRLQLGGWQSLLVPSSLAYHERGLRSVGDASSSVGTLGTVTHRFTKRPKQNRLSYRNHLLFLTSCFAFPSWSGPWFATLWYEFGKAVVLLLTEPSTLWFALSSTSPWRRALVKRRQIRTRRFILEHVQRWLA